MTTTEDVAALDDRFVSEWGRRFLEAWNGLDGPAVAALCTADVIWADPSAPEPLIGRTAVRDFVQRTAAAFPDLQISETEPPCVVPGRARVLAPVFVSLTDFQIHRMRHAPSAWRAGLNFRRSWPRLDGAIGLWLWSEPWKLRSGAVSIWRSHDDLLRFIRSPAHRAIIRGYNDRMSGASSAWHAPQLDRRAIWTEAMDRLNSGTVPS